VREVPETHAGLLYVDGVLRAVLPPGSHAFWALGPCVAVELVDLRIQALAHGICAAATQDRRRLRLEVDASWRIADAARAVRTIESPAALLRTVIGRALAAAIAALPLEACLDGRREIERAALADARDALAATGIEPLEIAIRDCVLARPFAHALGKVARLTLYAGADAKLDANIDDLARLRI
jgi:regulator of protease activity HflC (stomatin/prohibitin superfamily)